MKRILTLPGAPGNSLIVFPQLSRPYLLLHFSCVIVTSAVAGDRYPELQVTLAPGMDYRIRHPSCKVLGNGQYTFLAAAGLQSVLEPIFGAAFLGLQYPGLYIAPQSLVKFNMLSADVGDAFTQVGMMVEELDDGALAL